MNRILFLILLGCILSASCKKAVTETNQGELITTIVIDATNISTGAFKSFQWKDIDGPGGASPVIDSIKLETNSSYDIEVRMFDHTKTPAADVSSEILEEGEVHRIYYDLLGSSGMDVTTTDLDQNNMPLGLQALLSTSAATSGRMKITLRHYSSGGKAAADMVNSPKSSTDAEVEFPITVQ